MKFLFYMYLQYGIYFMKKYHELYERKRVCINL